MDGIHVHYGVQETPISVPNFVTMLYYTPALRMKGRCTAQQENLSRWRI